jgi:hypothetical protein
MKYTKTYLSFFALGFFLDINISNIRNGFFKNRNNNLALHKTMAEINYTKNIKFWESLKGGRFHIKGGVALGVFGTVWTYLIDFFAGYGFSTSQALFRATAIVSPVLVFLHYDRPIYAFGPRSIMLFSMICNE